MSDQAFMQEAGALALKGVTTNQGGPFGAVVVKDGEIIARGFNRVTSTLDPTAHAEVVAIREACQHLGTFELKGCVIYTSCEPCPMCLTAIYWARLDRIFYACSQDDAARIGFDDRYLYEQVALPAGARSLPMEHLADETSDLAFRTWDEKPDKIAY